MDSCRDDETIGAFVAGRLPTRAHRQLQGHLDGCPACKERVIGLVSRLSELTARSRATGSAGQEARIVEWLHGRKLGRYVFLDDVGPVGVGTVYAAYDNLLDRKVALEFLPGAGSSQPTLTRVLANGAAMARLSHPNVVRVHDVAELEGLPYLSMELVEGVTLAVWRIQAPRSFREIARVMAAAARGLAAAHAAGIIHRAVTPESILVAGPRVLVTDFRLAPVESDRERGTEGTPAYMAPEQLRGDPVDVRTDVFGFCATLYETLHGVLPFPGTSVEEVRAQVTAGRVAQPPARSRAPAHLARIALRGLDPEPARRPADMNRLADELLADPVARWRNGALAVAAAAAGAVAFALGGYLKGNPERQCRLGAEVIARAWNDGRRAQLRHSYAAAGQQPIWPLLERRLGEFTDSWRASYGETCAIAYRQGRRQDAVFDLQMQCLEGQRATMEAFVAALSSPTTPQLVRAAGAVLPEPASCRLSARPETRPLPADPQLRAQIAAVEQSVAVARAAELLGDYPRAADTAGKAIEAARKLEYQPLLASALVRLASVEAARASNDSADRPSGLDRAAALLTEAYAVAE